jgi:DNA-cytosine methyltransferase
MDIDMNILSLFDGISCCRVALERANIPVDKYYASEIDKHAITIAQKNYPNTVQLGDVTKWQGWNIDFASIDIVTAGFPCQAWSTAGKQLGDKDPRGALFWTTLDIISHIKKLNPNVIFLLENVKMKREFEEYITYHTEQALGSVNKYLINSALVSAQNRQRYYWTNVVGVNQPEDKEITWGDVREHNVESDKYYYTEKALQWLARHSRKKNKILKIHGDGEKMQMLEASHHKKYSSQRFFGIVESAEQCVGAIRGRYIVNGKRQDGKQLTAGLTTQYIEFRYDGKTNTLTTVSKDNVVVPFTLPNRVPASEFFFRYITPIECERLQTLPDNYTEGISNTQRYKCLGNGWTVDVIAHIFKHIDLS